MITPEEIKSIRVCLGLTQDEIGQGVGYSRSYICKLESGDRPIDINVSEALEAYFERMIRSRLNHVNTAQIVINALKNRQNCQQVLISRPKNHLSSGG